MDNFNPSKPRLTLHDIRPKNLGREKKGETDRRNATDERSFDGAEITVIITHDRQRYL